MATVITLAQSKGGTGKTTLAVNIAAELFGKGYRVAVVDCDPQGSALEWAGVASEAGHAGPTVVGLRDNVRQALPSIAAGFDVVIVDTPGRGSRAMAAALLLSDLALLPVGPSPVDVWGVRDTLETLAEVQEMRPELLARIVLNGRQRTALSDATPEALEGTGIPVLGTELGRRVAFAESFGTGQGVTIHARGTVASLEVRRLVEELEELLQLEAPAEGRATGPTLRVVNGGSDHG